MKFTSSCFLCCTTAMAAWPCPDPSQGPVICHLLEGQGGGGQIGKLSPDRKWTHCPSLHPGPWVTPRVGMLSPAVEFKSWEGWLCVWEGGGGYGEYVPVFALACLCIRGSESWWQKEDGWLSVYNWVWPCASVACTCIHTCEGVHQCACPSDPMCPYLHVESMMPCRFFVCVGHHCLPPLERVQLPSSGGGNRTLSCLACDFCLDTSFCCDRTYSQDPGQSAWLS